MTQLAQNTLWRHSAEVTVPFVICNYEETEHITKQGSEKTKYKYTPNLRSNGIKLGDGVAGGDAELWSTHFVRQHNFGGGYVTHV